MNYYIFLAEKQMGISYHDLSKEKVSIYKFEAKKYQ